MFDLLKKKISSFTEKVKDKVQTSEKPAVQEKEEIFEEEQLAAEPSRELKAKPSVGKKIKGIVTGKVKIGEKDIDELTGELELSLLEADVEQEAAEHIVNEIKEELAGKEIAAGNISGLLRKEIREILLNMMETEQIDFLGMLEGKKPFIVLFLGPNGAGKTTSIAKISHMLLQEGKKVVLASSDTFRAGSIEQLKVHADRLGVRIIKHQYGADPAAVAFDAVESAKAKGEDVVLIDSAGRQETNKNLMEELKKIVRVAKPDLKIYVGESYTGQALLQQASEFNEALDLDGFILTKIDTDPKGGTAISLLYKLKKPILFLGTGQEYGDLEVFEPEFIVNRIVGE